MPPRGWGRGLKPAGRGSASPRCPAKLRRLPFVRQRQGRMLGGWAPRGWGLTRADDLVLLLDFKQLERCARHVALLLRSHGSEGWVSWGQHERRPRAPGLGAPSWSVRVTFDQAAHPTLASLKKWSCSVCFVHAATTGRCMLRRPRPRPRRRRRERRLSRASGAAWAPQGLARCPAGTVHCWRRFSRPGGSLRPARELLLRHPGCAAAARALPRRACCAPPGTARVTDAVAPCQKLSMVPVSRQKVFRGRQEDPVAGGGLRLLCPIPAFVCE